MTTVRLGEQSPINISGRSLDLDDGGAVIEDTFPWPRIPQYVSSGRDYEASLWIETSSYSLCTALHSGGTSRDR